MLNVGVMYFTLNGAGGMKGLKLHDNITFVDMYKARGVKRECFRPMLFLN